MSVNYQTLNKEKLIKLYIKKSGYRYEMTAALYYLYKSD